MEIVDGRSAGGMVAESAQALGFPACLFAIGAPGKGSGFFADALKHAIREGGDEGVNIGEQPDSRKTFDAASLNAVPGSAMPHLIEGQSWLEVLQNWNETSAEVLSTAVDIDAKPSPIVADDVMQTLAMQVAGETENPVPATGILNVAASENEAPMAQWVLSGPMPVPAEVVETGDIQQQPVPTADGNVVSAAIISPVVSEETATGELSLKTAAPENTQISGPPIEEVVGEFMLELDGSTSQDIPVIPVKSMPPIRGEPPVEKPVVFADVQVWAPEAVELSSAADEQLAPTSGNVASAGSEKAMAVKDSILVANNLGGQKPHEAISSLTAEAFPSVALDASVTNAVPEQPTYSDAKGTLNIGQAQLFDQLVQGVRVAQNTGGTEVLVHLKPDFLGRLSIRATADDHGIHVEIRAENAAVRQVMQDNLADLQQWLADRDLAFNQLSILADTGWHSHREPQLPVQEPAVWSEAEPEMSVEMAIESAPRIQSGTIDYFA